MGIQAEKELDVLDVDQSCGAPRAEIRKNTYTHSVGQGAIHVTKKEISELDGV